MMRLGDENNHPEVEEEREFEGKEGGIRCEKGGICCGKGLTLLYTS